MMLPVTAKTARNSPAASATIKCSRRMNVRTGPQVWLSSRVDKSSEKIEI
jgi:hypothetical protein